MDKDKKEQPEKEDTPIRSINIDNAHASGDGALERSDENDLKEADISTKPETPY